MNRAIAIAVVVIVVVGGTAAYGIHLLATPPPKPHHYVPMITLTNLHFASENSLACDSYSSMPFNATFDLVNTGNSSGFATVTASGSYTLASDIFYVQVNQTGSFWMTVSVACSATSLPNLAVTSQKS